MKRPDSGDNSERRGGSRAKVRKVGRVVIDEPRKIYLCIILDLSETGALLLVHEKVPDKFELFYSAKRMLWPVEVVRRHQDTLGVRFLEPGQELASSDSRLFELRA